MSDGAPANPPMEEILASIKRIIREDPAGARPPAPAAWPMADEDVLELGSAPAAEQSDASAAPALVSSEARDASRQALAALAGLRVDPNAGADTLDGLVREMLRPMLKDWLDANLPELVERVVAREVARLTGR